MAIPDVPAFSLEILKHNIPDYDDLTPAQIEEYFNINYDVFALPNLPDEEKGLAILKTVIEEKKLIIIAGDYDADGLSGVAIGHKALKHKCDNYRVINNKRVSGNGFTEPFMDVIKEIHKETPIGLLISVDHGSNNVAAVDEMHSIGIENVIITDHHSIVGDGVTNADAFISPQRGCPELIGMCGAYVLFKLLSGLYINDKDIFDKLYRPCLPHVGIATVADVMSLNLDYNRRVVRAGLQIMNSDTKLWRVLRDKLNIPLKYTYKDIPFVLAPFINTGNRVSSEDLFRRILIEEDMDELSRLVDIGIGHNIRRKKVNKEVTSDSLHKLSLSGVGKSISLIVDTQMSINGIIASKLGEEYNVPATCFILNKEKGILYGSARAILDHISIVDVFNKMASLDSGLFLTQGGHKGAGGCSIPFEKYDVFKDLFEKVVSSIEVPKIIPDKEYIIEINTRALNHGIVDDIDYCGPYGKDWPMPKLRGMFKVKSLFAMANMAIFTLTTPNNHTIKATYFYSGDDSKDSIEYEFGRGTVITAVFEPQYYSRRQLINFTLLIHNIKEA